MAAKFKPGDTVRCVKSTDYGHSITQGKEYVVQAGNNPNTFTYVLMDHNGEQGGFYHDRFELVKAYPPPRKVVSVAERSQTTIVPGYDVTYDDGTTEWMAK